MTDKVYDLTVWKDNSTILNNFRNYISFINDCHTIRYTIDNRGTVKLYAISRVASCSRTFEAFMKSMTILKQFINTLKKDNENGEKVHEIVDETVDTIEKITIQEQGITDNTDEDVVLSENEYVYVVSINSYDGDLSKSQCAIYPTKDDAIKIAFSYATSQDANSEFDETGCYSLRTHSITTHCLRNGTCGHMNSLYKKPTYNESTCNKREYDDKPKLTPIITGNVHIDYDVELSDIFTERRPMTPTKPHVEEDNKIGNIDLHQISNHSRSNMHDIHKMRKRQRELSRFGRGRGRGLGHTSDFWKRKHDAEFERFQKRKMMEMDSRNDELERDRFFNSRYHHHNYNVHRRRHNQFMDESSYPRRCNFRSYEHMPFAEEVHVDIDTGTGAVSSVKRESKKRHNNYNDYDTNFWSTDDSEDDCNDIEECQDEPDELDGPVPVDISDSGIEITVIGDSDDEDTMSKHEQDLASITSAFAELEKMDNEDGEKNCNVNDQRPTQTMYR